MACVTFQRQTQKGKSANERGNCHTASPLVSFFTTRGLETIEKPPRGPLLAQV